jgi:hypothetical protein
VLEPQRKQVCVAENTIAVSGCDRQSYTVC